MVSQEAFSPRSLRQPMAFLVVFILLSTQVPMTMALQTVTTTTAHTGRSPRSHDQNQPQQRNNVNAPAIVACASMTELFRAVQEFVQTGDRVVELGAGLSDVSTCICDAVGSTGSVQLVLAQPLGKRKKSGRTKQSTPADFMEGGRYGAICELMERQDGATGWGEYSTLLKKDEHIAAIVMDPSSMLGNDLPLTTLSSAQGLLQQLPSTTTILVHSTKLASLARRLIHARHVHRLPQGFHTPLSRSNQPLLVAGVGVDEYRSTIPTLVQPGDAVLEIGCHGGYSTTLLHEAASATEDDDTKGSTGYCIGVDIGKKIIQRAKSAYPDIPFAVADGFNVLELLKLKSTILKDYTINSADTGLGYDVVYVDVGGLSGADGILETVALVDTISQSLQPKAIVVKSLCLQRLSGQLHAFSEIWNDQIVTSRNS